MNGKPRLICCVLIVVVLDTALLVQVGGAPRKSVPPILKLKVGPFALRDASMDEALRELRKKNKEKILIGFAEVAHAEGTHEGMITLDMDDTTVGSILDNLVKADPRYT